MRASRIAAAAVYATLIITPTALGAVQLGLIGSHGGGARPAAPRPWPIPPPASATIDVGATTLALAQNSYRPWTPKDLVGVNALEQRIHKHLSVVMWYADWAHSYPLRQQLAAVSQRGSVPEITWEPWNSIQAGRSQPRYRLRNIIHGRFDSYIRSWAKTLAAYGQPVRLRFAQEMNGDWYPWSEPSNGNYRGEFVRAWDHVHRIFAAAGATNVQWIWSIARLPAAQELYPGPREVDMVSTTIFNGGMQLRFQPWRSFARLIADRVRRLEQIAPGKPIEVSEVGCAPQGGSKVAWIRGVFSVLRRQPRIRSIIWYDLVKRSDWRIESSDASAEAFRRGVANARYR
jgi:Glycosyl hydrolase family 26